MVQFVYTVYVFYYFQTLFLLILPLNLVYYQLKSSCKSRLITSLFHAHETAHSGTKGKTNIFLDKRTVAEGKFGGRVEAKRCLVGRQNREEGGSGAGMENSQKKRQSSGLSLSTIQ